MDCWTLWNLTPEAPRGPLRMEPGWLQAAPPLKCAHCHRLLDAGEWFFPRGWCPMTGLIDLAQASAFTDMLEPAAEHVACTGDTSVPGKL